jgi:catechol 2,3-dioxygenase-like lactoylglutathione lyase family enzyme
MIRSVLTTALTVGDMERSLAFYRHLLGFEVAVELPPPPERERWDVYHEQVARIPGARIRVVYLRAPDGISHLELIEYLAPKPAPRPRRELYEPGTAIVALSLRGSEAAVARLREAGVDVLADPVHYRSDAGDETYTTYFRDPDGNVLCLFETVD